MLFAAESGTASIFITCFGHPYLKKGHLTISHPYIIFLIIPNEGHRKLLEDIWIRTYAWISWNLVIIFISSPPDASNTFSPRHPTVFHFISGHDLAMAKILQVPQLWSCFNFSFGSQSFNHFEPMIFHIWPPKPAKPTLEGTQVPHLSTNHFQQVMPFGAWSTCQSRRCQTAADVANVNIQAVQLCEALPCSAHSRSFLGKETVTGSLKVTLPPTRLKIPLKISKLGTALRGVRPWFNIRPDGDWRWVMTQTQEINCKPCLSYDCQVSRQSIHRSRR